MNFSHLVAMTWARTLEFLRDRSSLAWNLMVPVIMVAGIGWVFSGPGRPLFKVAVVSAAPLSPSLHPFLATSQVQFYREEDDLDAAIRKVQRHRIDLLIDL